MQCQRPRSELPQGLSLIDQVLGSSQVQQTGQVYGTILFPLLYFHPHFITLSSPTFPLSLEEIFLYIFLVGHDLYVVPFR